MGDRQKRKALSIRNAKRAEAQGLISRLEKLCHAPVASVAKTLPALEPLTDTEQNARCRMLEVQAETLRQQAQMTDEEFEARRKMLEEQKRELMKNGNR